VAQAHRGRGICVHVHATLRNAGTDSTRAHGTRRVPAVAAGVDGAFGRQEHRVVLGEHDGAHVPREQRHPLRRRAVVRGRVTEGIVAVASPRQQRRHPWPFLLRAPHTNTTSSAAAIVVLAVVGEAGWVGCGG
jgi:hypothetical protein